MGNKTNVIQEIYDRLTYRIDSATGDWLQDVKRIRVGSVEEARKLADFPIINISLDSGTEQGNFKNAASVDQMLVSITLLHQKLTLTNNALFRRVAGDGDTWTLGAQVNPNVNNNILAWFNNLRTRSLTTSSGVNGGAVIVYDAGSEVATGWTSGALSIGALADITDPLLTVMNGIRKRTFNVNTCTDNVLQYPTNALPGFTYAVVLGSITDPDIDSGIFDKLNFIRHRTLTVTDIFGIVKFQTVLVFIDESAAAAAGSSVTIGESPKGALVVLEHILNAIDYNTAGVLDITLNQTANNRRDINYSINETTDIVEINITLNIESKIFINGGR